MKNPFEEIDARLSNIESLILDIKHRPDEGLLFDPKKLLTLDELIDELPEHPAKQTIYGWVNNRKIPFEKHGSKLYFRRYLINEWLSNGRQTNHLK